MGSQSIVQGRWIGSKELESIRLLLTENPHGSRWRLSRALCELWDWRAPNGQIKDMAARTLLLKLEERGCLELPLRGQRPASRVGQKRLIPIEHATEPINTPLERVDASGNSGVESIPSQANSVGLAAPQLPLPELCQCGGAESQLTA